MSRTMNGIFAMIFAVLTVLTAVLLLVTLARADDGVMTWTANTEADLAGYNIFRGTTAGTCAGTASLPALLVAGAPAKVGKVTTFIDANLPAMDGTLCWELSAFDTFNNESGRSNRVSKVINNLPPLAPTGLGVAIQ